jgi:hypothetical protein
MVEILSTHVCKWKNETCYNYSRSGGGDIIENGGRSKDNMIYMIYCKNLCKCDNVLPAQQKIKKKKKTTKKKI